ncbi:MAG: hypothetical protein M3176_11745 [Chloroflexota bacterium]|nr:hypothetical protein [Chloroflexota bacterium]
MNERDRAVIRAAKHSLTRRTLFKGTLAASGTLALATFGGGIIGRESLVGAADDEMLPASKFTIKSTIAVNLTKHFARAPVFQGTFNGQPVWYVITEASDERVASDLGLNFAPRLANAAAPSVQQVTSSNPVLGRGMVTFAGAPNFGPTRVVAAGPTGFPPASFAPGADADAKYSDLVRVQGTDVVYNAPIVAVGAGPFDVTTHTNTHDRLIAIDTAKMTADLVMVRAFSHGKDILYHSFSASNPLAAPIERGTFVPLLGMASPPNTRTVQEGARSSIFAFVNGQTGQPGPPAQGLNHVILDGGGTKDASFQNADVLEKLRIGGDAHNILDSFPTLRDPALAHLYTPLWDLQLVKWSDDAVARGVNVAQTDANQIRQLAAQGVVHSPDDLPLVAVDIIVNCPVIGFIDQAPDAPQAADPGKSATAFRGAP